jgi:hypothetical protein
MGIISGRFVIDRLKYEGGTLPVKSPWLGGNQPRYERDWTIPPKE